VIDRRDVLVEGQYRDVDDEQDLLDVVADCCLCSRAVCTLVGVDWKR